jgi:6-phosphogluconolactonase/glucosamine-6-phosphate isomerase/deaminase
MHTVNETEMLAAQLDLLMKRLDNNEKDAKQGTIKALGSHMACEVCGNDGHFGTNCPKTCENVKAHEQQQRVSSTRRPRMEHYFMG